MANYCVTFRIANRTVDGQTYQDRYDAFHEVLRAEKLGYWEETTSFILVESSPDTYLFGKRIFAPLSSAHDMAFVFDPSDMSACYYGKVREPDVLVSFFPQAKELR